MSVTNKKSIQNIILNIDNETLTDDKVISNHFINSIAGKLAKKHLTQLKPFIHTETKYLKNPSSFHLYRQSMLKHKYVPKLF